MPGKIFISSTYRDLKSYRQAVINSLQTIGEKYEAMEFFCAGSNTPKQLCLQKVAESSIFILIIGTRYGSIDPNTKLSYTQLEYETAVKAGSIILPFLMDENVQTTDIDEEESAEKLLDFKETVKANFTVAYFTSEENLAKKVLEALITINIFSINSAKKQSSEAHEAPVKRERASWKGYNGVLNLNNKFSIAYIPIINNPGHDFSMQELSYSDIDIQIDTVPYALPPEFQSDKLYDEINEKRCRLSSYIRDEGRLKLFISETTYWDYLKSGEHLDEPYKHNPSLTNRDMFGDLLKCKSASFSLFNLTNICGCGLLILTSDNKLLVTKLPEESSVYPGRLSYSASGVMRFGNYPNPFNETLLKARNEINHQIDLKRLRMIGFGADARKLYFQFSFLESVKATFDDMKKQYDGFIPINFEPNDVIQSVVYNIWEPSAEAMILTLLIKQHGYESVMEKLDHYKNDWRRHEIKDEWDYRAVCGGMTPALSIRYPKENIAELSIQYVAEILKFMGNDVKGKDILEIGSGDGRVTEHLVNAGASKVTCVDICERMINKSKTKMKQSLYKLDYVNEFAQDYRRSVAHDAAVISLVLIHTVEDSDFQNLVKNVCRNAGVIYVFEDITQNRPVSPYTKLRTEKQIIDEFEKNNMYSSKRRYYRLVEDKIMFIRFSSIEQIYNEYTQGHG